MPHDKPMYFMRTLVSVWSNELITSSSAAQHRRVSESLVSGHSFTMSTNHQSADLMQQYYMLCCHGRLINCVLSRQTGSSQLTSIHLL